MYVSRQPKHHKEIKKQVNNSEFVQLIEGMGIRERDVWNPEYEKNIDLALLAPSEESVTRREFVDQSRHIVRDIKDDHNGVIMKVIDEQLEELEHEYLVEVQFT